MTLNLKHFKSVLFFNNLDKTNSQPIIRMENVESSFLQTLKDEVELIYHKKVDFCLAYDQFNKPIVINF